MQGNFDDGIVYLCKIVNTSENALKPVEVIIKPGNDHHPHSLPDPKPIVDFILRAQAKVGAR